MRSSYKLFDKNSATKNPAIDETIAVYFECYILDNLNRLKSIELIYSIQETLGFAKKFNASEFKAFLLKKYNQNFDINCIYSVLQRILKGELTKMDPLMASLYKIDESIPLDQYNFIISEKTTMLLNNYFNNVKCMPLTSVSSIKIFNNL